MADLFVYLKISVFLDVTRCCLIDTDHHFGGNYCYHLQDRRVGAEAAHSSETLTKIFQITRRHTPEDNTLHGHVLTTPKLTEICKGEKSKTFPVLN
jgi:hypothetical protein